VNSMLGMIGVVVGSPHDFLGETVSRRNAFESEIATLDGKLADDPQRPLILAHQVGSGRNQSVTAGMVSIKTVG
jgi:hypothetical protein